MSRVLVTGGAGTIGGAVVRRLLADPDWQVRVADQREPPDWIRQSCEVVTGDLREPDAAARAPAGSAPLIPLAAIVGGIGNFHRLPYTLLEMNTGLYNAVFRGALDAGVERLGGVAVLMVFESPTPCPPPQGSTAPPSSPPPRSTSRTLASRSRPTASRSSPARCTAARCTTSSTCRSRSAGRSTHTGPGRCPTTSPACACRARPHQEGLL